MTDQEESAVANPDRLWACKRTGYLADEDGNCTRHGGDACVLRFVQQGPFLGRMEYGAWFLSGPGMREQQVTRDDYLRAERSAGFHPKPGCGPEATGSFGVSGGLSGRHVTTWEGRVYEPSTTKEQATSAERGAVAGPYPPDCRDHGGTDWGVHGLGCRCEAQPED